MRYHNPLDGLLFSTTATRVLRALLQADGEPLSGRELGRRARTPPHRTSEALRRFRWEGVALGTMQGRAQLWSINPRSPLLPALRGLFEGEQGASLRARGDLRRGLKQIGGVQRAIVFGSAARRDEGKGSDLDLLVVAANRPALKRIEAHLFDLEFGLWRKGGFHLRSLTYTAPEYARKKNLPVIRNAEREGEILIGSAAP